MENKTVKELKVLCKTNKIKGCYGRKADIIKKLKEAGVTLEPKRTRSRSRSPKKKSPMRNRSPKEKVVFDRRSHDATTKAFDEGYYAIIAQPSSQNEWSVDVYDSLYTDKKSLLIAYNRLICQEIENTIEKRPNIHDIQFLGLYENFTTFFRVIFFKPLGKTFYVDVIFSGIEGIGNFSVYQFADKDTLLEESKNPKIASFTVAYIDTVNMKRNLLNPEIFQTSMRIENGYEI